jgi:hypothetical protein
MTYNVYLASFAIGIWLLRCIWLTYTQFSAKVKAMTPPIYVELEEPFFTDIVDGVRTSVVVANYDAYQLLEVGDPVYFSHDNARIIKTMTDISDYESFERYRYYNELSDDEDYTKSEHYGAMADGCTAITFE